MWPGATVRHNFLRLTWNVLNQRTIHLKFTMKCVIIVFLNKKIWKMCIQSNLSTVMRYYQRRDVFTHLWGPSRALTKAKPTRHTASRLYIALYQLSHWVSCLLHLMIILWGERGGFFPLRIALTLATWLMKSSRNLDLLSKKLCKCCKNWRPICWGKKVTWLPCLQTFAAFLPP